MPTTLKRSALQESKQRFDEQVGVPKQSLGKAYQYSKAKMSKPSVSVDAINVPEIENPIAEFIYNYYVRDERIKTFKNTRNLPLEKIPRYVTVGWNTPQISDFEIEKEREERQVKTDNLSIKRNASKIVSEDNFFNPGYVNHTFSNIDGIEQGAADLEVYSRLSQHDAESVFKMAKYQIQEIAKKGDKDDAKYEAQLASLTNSFSKLSDLPKNAIGLRVYDEKKNLNDKEDLLRSITNSLTLTMQLNKSVIPDFFKTSKEKMIPSNLNSLQEVYAEFLRENVKKKGTAASIEPIYNSLNGTIAANLTHPVRLTGYVIDRYVANQDGFFKDKTFYFEDIRQNRLVDTQVLYGVTYIYAIRVIADVKILTYSADRTKVNVSSVYVSSRPISVPVECYEYTPPPEPNDIRFSFDYVKRNLKIIWDMPVNPQRDVKQFQVMRRKSIREPFELIAQYCFDNSAEGPGNVGRYKTGERVDGNNIEDMLPEDRYLVKFSDAPVFMHTDEDFTVDTEFFVSSEYIYAICSVDAHGIISNYSSQHHIVFDPYKNRLMTKVVCDAGSPRPYPNMMLRTDAFKDVIKVEGDIGRKLNLYFTPEYLKVRDERNAKYKIIEAQTTNNNPYYVMQMINLDNQKTQLLKINIKDPQNLTK
jgi:hypothetical protein